MEGDYLLSFLNKSIRARFRDGNIVKTAEGRLEAVSDGFVKIVGERGTIVINERNVVDMAEMESN